MFYLNLFFKNILDLKLKGITTFLGLILAGALLASFPHLSSEVGKISRYSKSQVYFNVLTSTGTDFSSVQRKLKNLPGVKSVSTISSNLIESKMQELAQSTQLKVPKSFYQGSYQALKIVLDENVSAKSQNLVREYVDRIVGPQLKAISPVKRISPLKNLKLNELEKNVGNNLVWIFYCLLFAILVSGIVTLNSGIALKASLIETYQRKKQITFKTMISVLLPVLILSYLLFSSLFSTFNLQTLLGYTIAASAIIAYVSFQKQHQHS